MIYVACINSLKIDENRYKQKYRLIRILGVIGMSYSLQKFRYMLFKGLCSSHAIPNAMVYR